MARFAFVTLVTSDLYAKGALVVAAALRELHPTPTAPPEVPFDTVCIVTPETIDVSTLKALRKAFDVVVGVEVIDEDQASRLMLLGRPDLKLVLTKLHVFRLTQYEKIIFLDADVLPVRTLSHLFTLPHEFSAVPDVGWPDIFNSGVMVLSPGEDKFNALMALVKSKGSWDGGDQGLLNEWRGEDWNRLSFTYNTTPTAAYTYAPAYERFGYEISVIHFIGPNKPWASEPWRPPFAQSSSTQTRVPGTQQSYAYESLVDRWFDVYDRHFRASPAIDQPSYTVEKYEAAWDAGSARGAPSSRFNLDELKRLALEGSSVIPSDPSGEAEYRSLPLEGRLDLMRAQSPPPPPPALPTSINVPVAAVDQSAPLVDQPPAPTDPPGTPSYESVVPIYQPDTTFDQTSAPPFQPPPFVDQTAAPPSLSSTTAIPLGVSSAQAESVAPLSLSSPIAIPPGVPSAQAELQAAPSGPVSDARGSLDEFYEPSPPPPPSPPLIDWNPAIEPPPSAPPLHTPQEPIASHFTNVWDLPPAHRQHSHNRSDTHDHSFQHISDTESQTPVHAEDFFPVPFPPSIPARLVHQGTYANVAHTQPDYSKVTGVFPWEERPRRAPGRVFPVTDPPPPGMPYLDLSKPLLSGQQPTPETRSVPPDGATHQVLPSPSTHQGPPGSLIYANVWDSVPSIQDYVSRLVKPVPNLTSLVTSSMQRAPKDTDKQEHEDGHEGDDEDEGGESEEDEPPKSLSSRSGQPSRAVGSHPRGPSSKMSSGDPLSPRRGSKDSQTGARSTSQYKSQGVQTVPKSRRSQGVQVDQESIADVAKAASPAAQSSPTSGSGQSAPPQKLSSPLPPPVSGGRSTPPGVPSPAVEDSRDPSPTERRVTFGSPVQSGYVVQNPGSPFQAIPRSAKDTAYPTLSTALPTSTLRERPVSSSTDPHARTSWMSSSSGGSTAVASYLMSPREMSPHDSLMALPRIPAGRRWDPARGVDVFKRDNEEVLARFLKMGQWGGHDTTRERGGGSH